MNTTLQHHPRHEESGFTLLEILVALAILGFALAVILPAMVTGMRAVTQAADTMETVELAQSLLAQEEVALPPAFGKTNGVTADGTYWRIDVEPWAGNPTPRHIGAYSIVISITRNGHTTSFSTLLTGPVANAPP